MLAGELHLGSSVQQVQDAQNKVQLLLIFPQHLACDHQSLDLAGSFVDLRDAGVAVVPFSWHVRHVAHPAQNLDGLIGRGGVKARHIC